MAAPPIVMAGEDQLSTSILHATSEDVDGDVEPCHEGGQDRAQTRFHYSAAEPYIGASANNPYPVIIGAWYVRATRFTAGVNADRIGSQLIISMPSVPPRSM